MNQSEPPSANRLKKLLVCVGAQKAGTTWLYEMLAADARLKTPLFVKEVQYFNYLFNNAQLINDWRVSYLVRLSKNELFRKTLRDYLQYGYKEGLLATTNKPLFRKITFCLRPLDDEWYYDYMAMPEQKLCAIDISPEYALIGQLGFRHIEKLTRDLKLVYILRDPIERSWSGMIQELKNKKDAQAQLQKMATAPIAELVERANKPNIKLRSNYLETLQVITAAGLANKLKIIFYDDIVSTPHQVLDNIYTHIDIHRTAESAVNVNKIVHKSPSVSMPAAFAEQMQTLYAPMLAEIDHSFIALPPTWKEKYRL